MVDLNFFETGSFLLRLHHHLRLTNLIPRMMTGSRSSALNVRGMRIKQKSKDQGDLIVANGGGVQHTRSGGDMDRVHRRVMLWR